MIGAHRLTQRYGDRTAIEDLSFTNRPGIVSGFLGPRSAGKSTAIRLLLGRDAPTADHVTVNGLSCTSHEAPLHDVGPMLEARAVHTAYHRLPTLAATTRVPGRRVNEVIDLNAGQAVLSAVPDPAMSPWPGLSFVAGYAAAR